MKRRIIFLAALNLFWMTSCESKKQAGEEYYDPNYKPSVNRATTQVEDSNAEAPGGNTGGTASATGTGTQPADAEPAGDAPVAVKDTATGKPARKSEATVAVVPKDKLQPTGKDYTKGKNLIAKSDCLSCHKDDAKLVGPAYVDVAEKYKPTDANITMLANKIIKGGAGNWGQIPMSPHPNLSLDDAKEMTRYILSLKK